MVIGGQVNPHRQDLVTAVRTARTGLGQILVDANGRTLYLFESDSATNSTCYGACASAWPPATTAAAPHAGTGASAAFLGTVHRTDGTNQLSYKSRTILRSSFLPRVR